MFLALLRCDDYLPHNVGLLTYHQCAAGKLPANFPIPWRGDSNLEDGKDHGVDLSGGMYDAGDSVKFGLPMAFTATLLSWGVLEYGPAMEKAGQLASAQHSIRWITDYLLKAHASPQELYFQVKPYTTHYTLQQEVCTSCRKSSIILQRFCSDSVICLMLNHGLLQTIAEVMQTCCKRLGHGTNAYLCLTYCNLN